MSQQLTLIIQNGSQAGQTFKLISASQTIGRTSANQIHIADPTISRQHARITVQSDGVFIQDLDSANGTFVNGRRITGLTPLRAGDTLQIGTTIKLSVSQPGAPEAVSDLGATYIPGPGADSPAVVSAFSLVVQQGPQPGQTFPLVDGTQTIGRAPGNEIHIAEPTISKQHARLTVQSNGVFVQDLGSANGTFVNGQRITNATPLKAGDTLQIGSSVVLGVKGPGLAVPVPATAPPVVVVPPTRGAGLGWLMAVVALVVIIALAAAAWVVWQSVQPAAEQTDTVVSSPTVEPTATTTEEPTATPLPQVMIDFSVDKTTLQLGQCATLRWRVENAKEVRLDGESVPPDSSRKVCPQEPTKTYRLTALSLDGETEEQAIALTVPPTPLPPPDLEIEFTADQTSVTFGQCTTLRWRVENAQEVRLAGDKVGATGSERVCPTEPDNIYKLVVQPLEGASLEQIVTITVPPTPMPTPTATPTLVPTATPVPQQPRTPVIDKFIADQYSLNQGSCTSLRWTVRNAQTVQLSGGEIGNQNVGNQGARQVCPPAASTTYNLVATGSGGSDQRSITINTSAPGGQAGPTPGIGGGGTYVLTVGKHIYEPWGAPRGDICRAYNNHDFDDKIHMKGLNIELFLTNNSTIPVADGWVPIFITAKGKRVKACYHYYAGTGPQPGTTSSVTFFTIVEPDDYVRVLQLNVNGQFVQICLDPSGAQSSC